jgi:hypothetical protein
MATARDDHSRLVNTLLVLRSRLGRYRPEKHYMRGPGPKTLSKLGEMFRAESDSVLQERVPEQWMSLIKSMQERSPCKSGNVAANPEY